MREGRHMDKKIKKAIAEVVQILFGTGLFGLAVNQLILPFGLYNTGIFGDCSGYCEHTYGCNEDI